MCINTVKEEVEKVAYMMPAAAGPIALKRDIAVMAIPLAAPLWSCLCISFKRKQKKKIKKEVHIPCWFHPSKKDQMLSKYLPLPCFGG